MDQMDHNEGNNEGKNDVTRRQFLKYAVVAGAGLVAAAIAVPVVTDFLSPSWKKNNTPTVPVARADSIPLGVPTFVRFEERVPDSWLVTTENQGLWIVTKDHQNFTIFDPHCTHLKCPFYWDDKQGIFVCPCHGGKFDMDGKVLGGPPPRPLDRWEYILNQGEIEVTGRILKV
jgi:menaquinol-cytochrome c reductase iron-sulfur subunit